MQTRSITIQGLDADYKQISENVTLTNATGNATTQSFIRVYRAFMHNGSAANVGNIDIKISTTIIARITAGKAQTLMGVYTVPAGYTACILTQGVMSVQSGRGCDRKLLCSVRWRICFPYCAYL